MKHFFLGMLTMTLFSFAAVQSEIITIRPTEPEYLYVNYFTEYQTAKSEIKKYSKRGYTVKAFSVGGTVAWPMFSLVMEKY